MGSLLAVRGNCCTVWFSPVRSASKSYSPGPVPWVHSGDCFAPSQLPDVDQVDELPIVDDSVAGPESHQWPDCCFVALEQMGCE